MLLKASTLSRAGSRPATQRSTPSPPMEATGYLILEMNGVEKLTIIFQGNRSVSWMENVIENWLFALPTPSCWVTELRTEKEKDKDNYCNMYLRRNIHKQFHDQMGLSHLLSRYTWYWNPELKNKPSLFDYEWLQSNKIYVYVLLFTVRSSHLSQYYLCYNN